MGLKKSGLEYYWGCIWLENKAKSGGIVCFQKMVNYKALEGN